MRDQLFTTATLDTYRAGVERGVSALLDHVGQVRGPFSGALPHEVAPRVDAVDLDRPLGDLDEALAEVRTTYLDDAVWFHEPRYLAHLNCPVLIPALVAEVLVSSVNSSLDTWDQSAGGTLIERRLVEWTAERIGLGADADGVFTSGGTQSNLQALLMARGHAYLDAAVDLTTPLADVVSRLRVLTSRDGHFSVQKAATVLGLGAEAVVVVETDAQHRMRPDALEAELARVRGAGLVPMAVVATAGTTDFGAIDPLPAIADLCEQHGVWLHVDGAYGGGLLASRRRRHLLTGIERADSVTIDFHKTWFQPVSASAVLVRDRASLRHVTYHADYLNPRSAALPNQVDKSLQTTRRFDALKLWLTLRTVGADAVGALFDDVMDLAHRSYDLLRDAPDLEVAVRPTLSTLVFRYRPDGLDEPTADDVNPEIRRRLSRSGAAVVAGTRVDGRAWLKLTLLNPHTSLDDVAAVLALVREIGDDLLDDLRVREETC